MNFFHTFRIRLLIILAILLIVTLGVQYLMNLNTERQNEHLREMQTQIQEFISRLNKELAARSVGRPAPEEHTSLIPVISARVPVVPGRRGR